MLELNFSNILAAVTRFRRAVKEKVAGTTPSKNYKLLTKF